MTTIKTITSKDFTKNGKTTTSYTVTLADGVTGYLDEKNSNGGLKDGDKVEYTMAVKKNQTTGKEYNLLSVNLAVGLGQGLQSLPPSPPPAPPRSPNTPAHFTPGAILDAKVQASLKAMEFVINAYIADKLQWDMIKPNHKELTGYLWDAIDECQG